MYNVSIAGGRVTILPTIKLSHAVNPQLVKQISNPNDVQHFQWQSLATAALDPLDFSGLYKLIKSQSHTRYKIVNHVPDTIKLSTLTLIFIF